MKRMLKKTTIAVAVSFTLSLALISCGGGSSDNGSGPSTEVVSVSELRNVKALMQNWQFVQDDAMTDTQALANDGANWSTVNLPHTWNANDAATTAQSTPTTPNYKRGLGWYRLSFNHSGNGATQWLQFDAASITADVWLNGEKLGQHRGAFTAFRFDVTGKLKAGNNVLVVKTDNRQARAATDPTAIQPLSGDFNMAGGLYRGVSLISTPSAAHIALDDFGSSGIFASTTSLSGNSASVNVLAKLKNASTADGSFTVQATLLEADGTTIKQTGRSTPVTIKAGEAASVAQDLVVGQAHLWNGLADPYLYKLVVELKDSSGASVDKVVQNFGLRTMRFDPNLGFFLNDKSLPLRGVNQHQDTLSKAWAITEADTDLSFAFIKEIGANTVRLAHYPHAAYTLEQADKLGVVVWAENALVNSVAVGGADPETSGFADNARQQMKELIRQQYNHASIGIWSIANEVAGGTDASNNVQPLLRSLHSLAKAEDPLRITSLAHQITRSGDVILPSPLTQTGITDSYSVNRYFQWYYGTSETQFGENLDAIHTSSPTQPIGVGEYGAGSAITHHSDNVLGGRVCSRDGSGSTRICFQPEEYANYVHEKAYAAIAARPYLMGTWIWNMFDFGSGNRHEGDIGQTNTKGLVTFGRDVKKDNFFFYKANWSQTPVTYISGRRYTERAYPVVTSLKVYSNADSVALKVNDQTVGTKLAASCPLKVCEFTNVPLQAGNNTVTAVGSYATTSVTDVVNWNLSTDNASNTYIAAGQLTTGFRSSGTLLGTHTYGSDNFYVGGELPPVPSGFSGAIGLSGNVVINGIGSTTVPETGRVWDMWREGSAFSYQIPMANGSYTVTLGFLEPTTTAAVGQRVFNVDANGVRQITDLDVLGAAGAARTAIARTFSVTVSNGMLTLDFTGVTGKAIVSNIAVIKQ